MAEAKRLLLLPVLLKGEEGQVALHLLLFLPTPSSTFYLPSALSSPHPPSHPTLYTRIQAPTCPPVMWATVELEEEKGVVTKLVKLMNSLYQTQFPSPVPLAVLKVLFTLARSLLPRVPGRHFSDFPPPKTSLRSTCSLLGCCHRQSENSILKKSRP